MNRTQIYLPKTQLDALRKVARKESTTVSGVVRNILQERFKKNSNSRNGEMGESLISAAIRIGAKWKGGPKDLASRLDDYLYGEK